MPSEKSIRVMTAMRAVRPLISQLNNGMQRIGMNVSRLAIRPMRGTSGRRTDANGVPGMWIAPRHREHTGAVILYLHGGGYVSGGLMYAQILASYFAAATDLNVLAIAYRLAPESPYPAALDDALTAWHYLRSLGYDADDIAIAGESAGGGLALAVTLALKDAGEDLPGAMVCFSPWADLTCSGESAVEFAETDAALTVDTLRQAALQYAAEDQLRSPYVSPIFGQFDGFPPTLIQVGGAEALLSDSHTLEKQMRSSGAPVTLEVYEGMCHVFQIYGFQESRHAMARAGLFLREKMKLPENDSTQMLSALIMWEPAET